jgi:hypothetical protein
VRAKQTVSNCVRLFGDKQRGRRGFEDEVGMPRRVSAGRIFRGEVGETRCVGVTKGLSFGGSEWLLQNTSYVRSAVEKAGLKVSTICAGYRGSVLDPDPSVRKQAIEEIKARLTAAAERQADESKANSQQLRQTFW